MHSTKDEIDEIMEGIESLKREDYLILVEGKKDIAALSRLGIIRALKATL